MAETLFGSKRLGSPAMRQLGKSCQVLCKTLSRIERKIIETALAESKGKVSGPEGAAAKLGIPPSTLDTKIKQLGIKKHRFISK